jgi:hypothetical protein
MLKRKAPMTNNERQRRFQAANPGYDARRKARQRQMSENTCARLRRASLAAAKAERARAAAEAPRPVLMLPAPVEDPVMAELDALKASLAAPRAPQAQPQPAR